MASQAFPAQGGNTFKQRPYSVAVPAFSQVSFSCQLFPLQGGVGTLWDAGADPWAQSLLRWPGLCSSLSHWDGMSGSVPGVLRMRGGAEGSSPTSVRCFRTT